jgi:uncharacterized protein (TIGR02246 family)
MKTSGRVLCLALLMAILSAGIASAAPQAASGSMQDKESAAITAAVQNYMDSWNTHNVHAVAAIYTVDCDFVNNFGDVTHGRDGMEKTFGPFMTGVYSATHQSGTVKSIRFVKPDVAAVDVTWEMTGALNQDGTPRPTRKGLHSLVMTKQDDGTWEIAVMHVHEYTATPRITNPGQITPPPAAH